MSNIIVLGAGMIGRAIAIDLGKKNSVLAIDINKQNLVGLPKYIQAIETDVSDPKRLKALVSKFDLVIGAVPGFMGFEIAKTVIEAGKDLVDISFFPEDAFELDKLAKKNGVTAIVDCGVAPGMDNILLGYHNKRMEVQNFVCMVGGLPFKRTMPFQYKAPFSPIDVIEEYTRPARYVVNGQVVTVPALSDIEEVNFQETGTLEAFNSDGLRSLIQTMKIPNMKEKTLRYPGHAKMMEQVREMGFFSKEEVDVKRNKIRPLDVTAAILFPQWKYEKDEEEFTVMRVIIEGKERGRMKRYVYDLFDRYDQKTETSSMARTTGYTCTAAANMVLEGLYLRKGISPPEYLGEEEKCFQFMMKYLEERGVKYKQEANT